MEGARYKRVDEHACDDEVDDAHNEPTCPRPGSHSGPMINPATMSTGPSTQTISAGRGGRLVLIRATTFRSALT